MQSERVERGHAEHAQCTCRLVESSSHCLLQPYRPQQYASQDASFGLTPVIALHSDTLLRTSVVNYPMNYPSSCPNLNHAMPPVRLAMYKEVAPRVQQELDDIVWTLKSGMESCPQG